MANVGFVFIVASDARLFFFCFFLGGRGWERFSGTAAWNEPRAVRIASKARAPQTQRPIDLVLPSGSFHYTGLYVVGCQG